jgi:hypothetical protein
VTEPWFTHAVVFQLLLSSSVEDTFYKPHTIPQAMRGLVVGYVLLFVDCSNKNKDYY